MSSLARKIDTYFIGLLLEVFILVMIFMSNKGEETSNLNFIMLGLIFLVIMITYTGGMILGLIITSLLIFLYASFVFYSNLVMNASVSSISYIWMVFAPVITFTTAKLSDSILTLQKDNVKLKKQYENLVTIHDETGLGTIKLFYRELDREISKFKRYNNPCSLMIIKLPYYKEIKKIVGEQDTNKIMKNISDLIVGSTRNEDERYILEDDTLAVIMPSTKAKDAKIVKERIKQSITNLNIKLREEKKYVDIETKVAIIECNSNIKNAIEFKALAEEELQYDV